MLGAGLLARNAVAARPDSASRGSRPRSRPGSKVVTEYLDRAGLTEPLEALGFNLVGYGCTTCIGNSGPLPERDLRRPSTRATSPSCSVLSRQPQLRGPHQPRREDELPRLAAARASPTRSPARWTSTCTTTRSAQDRDGEPVYLRDIWPSSTRSRETVEEAVAVRHVPHAATARCSPATSAGTGSRCPTGDRFAWDDDSTYVRQPPYFEDMPRRARRRSTDIEGARVLALLGDSVTTDHISPAGAIKRDSPAGQLPDRARRRAAATSTPTARGAATTR